MLNFLKELCEIIVGALCIGVPIGLWYAGVFV